MLTLHLPALPSSSTHRAPRPVPRALLRLRARWLAWRGVAVVHAVPVTDQRRAADHSGADRHVRALLELNLVLERARASRTSGDQHPGLAG